MTNLIPSCPAQASLAEAVRSIRKARGLSLAALASQIGTTPQRLHEFERGGCSMSLLHAASDALDIEWVGLPPGPSIGARLAILRQRKGWTPGALAQRTGIPRNTLVSIEADKAHMRSLDALLEALRLDVRPKAHTRPQPPAKRDTRLTSPDLVAVIQNILGGVIDLDPCGHPAAFTNPRRAFILPDQDGLAEEWKAKRVFVNPPFSKTEAFLQKAMAEYDAGCAGNIVFLMRVRTTTRSFARLIAQGHLIIFLRKKVAFVDATGERLLGPMSIPLQLVILSRDQRLRDRAIACFPDCAAINH